MIIYPDIEISGGKSVNLLRGLKEDTVVYPVAPLDAARKFEREGAQWLHVIDLDRVFGTDTNNMEIIREIIDSVDIPVQVAGGISTMNAVNSWFDHGAARIVLGTVAVTDRSLVLEASNRYPGAIVVSLDTREGHVMIDGWRTRTSFNVHDLARDLQNTGVAAVIHTDIDRFVGNPESSLALTTELGAELSIPVISTGTVRTLEDLARLKYLPNIDGAIIGRALFTETFSLEEAIAVAAQPDTNPERDTNAPPRGRSDSLKGGVRVYLAAFSSSLPTRAWNRELSTAISYDNPYIEVCLPQDDLRDTIDAKAVRPKDIQALYLNEIDDSDVVVVILDGIESKAWTGVECGYAKARGKRVIGVKAEHQPVQQYHTTALLSEVCDRVIYCNINDDAQQSIAYIAQELTDEILSGAGV